MKLNDEQRNELTARLATLRHEREKLVQEANVRIAYLDGVISANEGLLASDQPETAEAAP